MQETSKFSFDNEVEQKVYKGDVYYIEGGEEQKSVEYLYSSNETAMRPWHGIFSGDTSSDRCAVCGNPCSKRCSRCKAIKYW